MRRRPVIWICVVAAALLALQRGAACRKVPPPPPPPPAKQDIRFRPTKVVHYPLPPTPTLRPGEPTPLPDEPQ